MIKIMLVEDEPPILRDIKALIEKIDPDFKVVTCAYDGQQAITSLQEDLPDIVVTDIQMPVVDGLELIKYIKDKDLDIIPVILSGYSEFEYAKKAMSLGVADYLLKPVNPKELSRLMLDLSEKIRLKKQNRQRDYLLSLLDNEGSKVVSGGLDIKDSTHLLMLFCAGSFQTYSYDFESTQKRFWEDIGLEKLGTSFLNNGEAIWEFNGKTSSEKVVLFTLGSPSYERASYLADNFFNNLKASGTPITIIASPFFTKIQEVGATLQSLRYILRKSCIIGFSQIIKKYETKEEINTLVAVPASINENHLDKLVYSLKQGDIVNFKSELIQAFNYLENSRYPQIFVEKLLLESILYCRKSVSNPPMTNITDLELEISEAVYASENYTKLFKNLWYIFEELFELRSHDSADLKTTSLLMQKIEKYIKDNMSEPINLQLLSDKFGLVPPYLSRLFKEYKGMSPIDYLTSLKIERAKELIKTQNNLFTKDIASIVGYSDPLHFSKVFKKVTGLSPSEYKNQFSK